LSFIYIHFNVLFIEAAKPNVGDNTRLLYHLAPPLITKRKIIETLRLNTKSFVTSMARETEMLPAATSLWKRRKI